MLQYTVKYDQHVDCGGAYVKLYSADLVQEVMNEDSEYYIMFGKFSTCLISQQSKHIHFYSASQERIGLITIRKFLFSYFLSLHHCIYQ